MHCIYHPSTIHALTRFGVLVLPQLVDDLHVPAARRQRRHHALVPFLDGRRHLALRQFGRLYVVLVRRELGPAAAPIVGVARRQRSEMTALRQTKTILYFMKAKISMKQSNILNDDMTSDTVSLLELSNISAEEKHKVL